MFDSHKLRLVLASVIGCAIVSLVFVSAVRPDANAPALVNQQLLFPPLNFAPVKQQNKLPSGIDEIKRHFPKVDYDAPEPTDAAEKAKRRKKGKHYDNGFISKEPTRDSSGLISEWDFDLPAFPVAQSSAVVAWGGCSVSHRRRKSISHRGAEHATHWQAVRLFHQRYTRE